MQEVLVSKIFNYASTPTKNVEGQFWFNPSTNVLSRYNGTIWKPITVSSDDVAVLTDGSKVSLTSYLNTQIAALAEGIDSKQDKLETYKEKQGDRKINTTISSSASDDGGFTGDIIIHTNGVGDTDGAPHPGNITLSTGKSGGGGGNITLTTGDETDGSATGASLVLNKASNGGNIDITAGSATGENSESGKIKLNVPDKSGIVIAKDFIELNYKGDTSNPYSNEWKCYIGGYGDSEDTTDFSSGKYSKIYLGYSDYGTEINLGGENSSAVVNICNDGSANSNIINIGTAKTTNYINIGPSDSQDSTLTLNCGTLSGETFNTELTSSSDNNHIPTSKAVYDALTLKQNTLQFYTESITDAPGYPSGSGIYKEQISLGKNNYSQTINIGGSNNLQNINLGGSVGTYGIITIGTTGNNNQIQIGRDNTSTALEINANTINGNAIDKTALTESSNKLPTSQAVLNGLSSKQNATDNNLTTTDKTIVGAINELSADKQNTLKYYSESDSSTEPSSNNAQVSILESSDYQTTLNLGFKSSNGIQTINIGGSSNTRNINIGTKVCGENNIITIGNASDGVDLTINAQRALTLNTSENSDLQGTGIAKEVAEAPTNRKLTTEKAVAYNTSFKKELNKIYFNSGKINNDVFQLPKFPFTICVTCKVDSWFFDGSEQGQSLFQFGNGYRVTTSPWGALWFRDNADSPRVALSINGSTTGNKTYTSEYFARLGNIDDFLGKKHTIVAIARDPGDNPTRPNWNIYLDGVELTTIAGGSNKFNENDTPLNVPTHFVVNANNLNFYNNPASDNPLEIYDISLFDFDLSEEGSAYSVLDYANGKLIPPELYVEDITSTSNKLWFKVDPQIYEFGGKRILKDLSLHGFGCYVSTADNTVATDADAAYDTLMDKVDDHLTTNWIDKKASPQLYLERGVLSVPELANHPFKWPLTLAIEYELESRAVGNATNQNCVFFNYWDAEWTSPSQLKGFRLELIDNGRLYLYLGHPNDIISTEQFVAYTTNEGKGIPTGKHTIVVCIDGDIVDGGPAYLKMYLDGNELDTTVVTKTLSGNDLTGTRPLSICSAWNYSNPSSTGGVLVPINIARPYIFNFRIDDNYSPYTVEDYVKGTSLPSPITIGIPDYEFGPMVKNLSWSPSEDGTVITTTNGNTSYPPFMTNVVPRGYCWKAIFDVEITFSDKVTFELYTRCKRAYVEVYNYATGVTTTFESSGCEGMWGGLNPFGLDMSGHYKITIYGHGSLGGTTRPMFLIGAASSGTITRKEINLQYTILAPESHTVTEYDQEIIVSQENYNAMKVRGSWEDKVSTSINGDEITITVNQELPYNAIPLDWTNIIANIGTGRTLTCSVDSLSSSIEAIGIRVRNQVGDITNYNQQLSPNGPLQRSIVVDAIPVIYGVSCTILNAGSVSPIPAGTVFTIKGLKITADTRKIIPDSSGNNYTVLAVESGNITGTNEYWTGVVRGTSDNALSVTETALKKKPLTSLQFNVYGTDKKIIPGKYMRLIFSQDSNGNVTPTYISEEEWNDVYDV